MIHVTHDYDEAISLASKIGVINQGKIIQTGTPTDIFNKPKNDFIANLAGIKNFIPVYILPADINSKLKIAKTNGIQVKLQTESSGCKGYLIIPPDRIILSRDKIESSAQNRILGTVCDIIQSPYGYEITIDIGVHLIVSITRASFDDLKIVTGDRLWTNFKAGAVKFIEKS